ncbi:MAG TPA: Uma2 family endonuclease [Urbifossiella sp.]|nr:Uma2 family endonuclease [Urbifossiella sp.]
MSATTISQPIVVLMTAEEYLAQPDDGRHTELVRGRIVEMPSPTPAHGFYCANISGVLREYARQLDLGRVVSNDSGVQTQQGPDTVRGPDVAFFSYSRVPRGPLPAGYRPAPELVFEVRSPSDRWKSITAKAGEYLTAGVLVVCVLDPETRTVGIYTENEFPSRKTVDDELTLPDVFPDFKVPVRQFFE